MRAWTWVHFDAKPIVYPRPASAATLPPVAGTAPPGDGSRQAGDDDFGGLRDYWPGDSPRRIAWRSYARTGTLLVREYRGGLDLEPVWLDWDSIAATDTEDRVALLTRLVLDAFDEGRAWALRLPGRSIAPAQGRDQLRRSLHALAVTGLPA
jgi:uncharacterized protein (DUF58 family)